MRKTLSYEIAKTIGKLVSLEESKHLGGDTNQPTRQEAARTGLGQLALAMQPYEDNVQEDNMGDATSGLQRDVAIAMNKSGLPTPLGGPDPSEQNPAFWGNPALNATVAHNQPGPPSYETGFVKPEDRRGTSASQTGASLGTAPDGPDISTISDPLLRKIFSESYAHYSEAVMGLAKLTNNDIVEAEKVLAMDFPLDDTYKAAMIQRISALEGANGWDSIRESIESPKGMTKKQFLEAKGCGCDCCDGGCGNCSCGGGCCKKCSCSKRKDERRQSVGSLIGEWFSNSPKRQ